MGFYLMNKKSPSKKTFKTKWVKQVTIWQLQGVEMVGDEKFSRRNREI